MCGNSTRIWLLSASVIKKKFTVKLFRFFFLSLALLLGTGCAITKPSGPAQTLAYSSKAADYFLRGSMMEMQKQHPLALLEYMKAYQEDSSSVTICLALIRNFAITEQWGKSDHFLNRAIILDSSDDRIYRLMLSIGQYKNDSQIVERALRQLVIIHPQNAELWLGLAENFALAERWEEATESYLNAYQINDEFNEALFRAAEIYAFLEKWKKATKLFEEFLAIFPEDKDALFQLISIYYHTDKTKKMHKMIDNLDSLLVDNDNKLLIINDLIALKSFEPAEILLNRWNSEKESSLWYLFLGKIEMQKDNVSQAKIHFETTLALEEDSSQVFLLHLIALEYANHEQYESAINILERSLKMYPENVDVFSLLGNFYWKIDQIDQAILIWNRCLAIEPENFDCLFGLAMVYDDMKEFDKSDELYQILLELQPDDPTILNNFSYSMIQREINLEKALEMVEKALLKEPENPAFLDTIGWVYFKMGEIQKSLGYINLSLKYNESDPDVLIHKGKILSELGKTDAAKIFFEKALQIDPTKSDTLKGKP